MPNTLTSDQMQKAAEKPVVLDLDSATPPKRERPPAMNVDVEFKPSPTLDASISSEASPAGAKPAAVKPVAKTAAQKRAAARKSAGPPKDVKPAPFARKENIPVRVAKDDPDIYAIWNCAESPDESIRVSDERLLRFQRGVLKCKTAGDDEAVALANQYAGNKYIRGEEKYLNDPIISTLTEPPTYWYSQKALQRHQAQYKRDHA